MYYTRESYTNFLDTEINAQIRDFEQVVRTKALVLKSRGNVFVGKFQKLQDNGTAVFKVRNSDNMPRKNSFWTACYLTGEMGSFKNWGDYSWLDLRKDYQRDYSDAYCAWIAKATEEDFCLIGIKNLSIEFADVLPKEMPIIAFGPKDPPLQYLYNLKDIVADESIKNVNKVLDFDATDPLWNPTPLASDTDLPAILAGVFDKNNCVAIQGPPGTGKTYRLAQYAATLLKQGKSVLVTALTNQALMELAKKEDLKDYIVAGKVSKSSMTIDEKRELPCLVPIKENKCDACSGYLSLASFYVSSTWAATLAEIPFDYVLMDEASQALLPMIAAAFKLGKQVVWIGDQKQLSPIVAINDDIISDKDWSQIINGFDTLCNTQKLDSYLLSDTFRLMPRAADSTGVFYNNNLRSVSKIVDVPIQLPFINPQGGPNIIDLELETGKKAPINAFEQIIDVVQKIYELSPRSEIAVLSKFKDSIRELQKYFILNWKGASLPDTIKIETVDRVQGLTVDYCIFFIPNASLPYSLNPKLFNVATSRARLNTIIVADSTMLQRQMSDDVRKYILKAHEEQFVEFGEHEPKRLTAGDIGVTVVGKVDLSKFERKRTEIVEGMDNIYIIDTNVFVKCPDIISKIGSQYKVIIPATVLEELDKLKLKESVDKQALSNAAKNICRAFEQNFSKMEDADTSLLPNGFNASNPDCKILSVALKHKQEGCNPILLTSDNMLRSRAVGLGLKSLTLKEFFGK